jgi:MazG family protein
VTESEKQSPAGALVSTTPETATAFAESVAIMARLRAPDGCPWDREQSFDSIRKHTLEETYEVLDAIERRDWTNLTEELGDLLLQVLFYAQMAADEGRFTIADVLQTLNRKLIRRHPHVFGEAASATAGNRASVDAAVDGSASRVLANWEQIKKAEKSAAAPSDKSLLDEVQRAQPALAEAAKLGSKAAKVGFDWTGWRDLLAKLEEETAELVAEADLPADAPGRKQAMESELGDLLFTAVNLGRHLGLDAEMALRGTNARFRARFREMERVANEIHAKPLAELAPAELEALWNRAKRTLAAQSPMGAGK